MALKVEIVTPSRRAFDGSAEQVQVPGWLGQMGILPRHAALLTLTRAGVFTLSGASGKLLVEKEYVELSGTRRLILGPGFAEVGPDRVTLLVDLCEDAANVDKAAAADALTKAEAAMAKEDSSSLTWRMASKAADLARARLSA